MTTPRKSTPARASSGKRAADATQRARDLQPQATGANRGSPAAPVMKQFAKTKAESSGKP
jgi:hypothetical protein